MSYKLGLSLLLAGVVGGSVHAQSTRLQEQLSNVQPIVSQEVVEETPVVAEATPVVEETKENVWVGRNFSQNEAKVLKFFQDYGITDRMALAVILGNIRQESNFHPNICEGGARINYERCGRGGYGLIQWTTSFRYWGLGNHAKVTGGNPSVIDTQLSYLITEREWKSALRRFKNPNQSLDYYMKGAYTWLGWGIYGNRGYYSQDYYNRLSLG
jgi:hypothetical protein